MKAGDQNAVPLCQRHHSELHDRIGDEAAFFERYFNNPDAGKNEARRLWSEWTEG